MRRDKVTFILLLLILASIFAGATLSIVQSAESAQLATATPTPVGGEIWWMWSGTVTVIPKQWFPTPTVDYAAPTVTPTFTRTPTATPTRTATATPSQTPGITPMSYMTVQPVCYFTPKDNSNVNVRATPWGTILAAGGVKVGTVVATVGHDLDNTGLLWLQINWQGQKAWIAAWTVKLIGECADPRLQ